MVAHGVKTDLEVLMKCLTMANPTCQPCRANYGVTTPLQAHHGIHCLPEFVHKHCWEDNLGIVFHSDLKSDPGTCIVTMLWRSLHVKVFFEHLVCCLLAVRWSPDSSLKQYGIRTRCAV